MKYSGTAARLPLVVAALVIGTCGGVTHGIDTFAFTSITGTGSPNAAIGESQLFLDVLPGPQPGQVEFRFRNTGPELLAVTDVLFADTDGALSGFTATSFTGPGLSFSQPTVPVILPGGAALVPPFTATPGLVLVSDSTDEGLTAGETLIVTANLQQDQDTAELLNRIRTGEFRVGLQARGEPGGGAVSFINQSVVIPAPVAILLGSLGVGLVGLLRRCRML